MFSLAVSADMFLDNLWLYMGFPALLSLGIYFSYVSKLFQFRKFPRITSLFISYIKQDVEKDGKGYHPLKMFFAAIGGCIGIGNVVGVCTAVKIGGPGAILWIWITAIIGSLVKYSEVFLGMKYRRKYSGGFAGGPFYYLQEAFSCKHIAYLAAFLLCVYGVEVYVFSTLVNTFELNWHVPHTPTVIVLLILVVFGVYGGLDRIGKISAVIVPAFIFMFLVMCLWIIGANIEQIPTIFSTVINSAFAGHAAIGGFLGSTALMAMTQGISWGCYTGDIGIGYASVIHSESSENIPDKQASLAILGVFIDTFVICTLSLTVIMITNVWQTNMPVVLYIQKSLGQVIPYMNVFMPVLFGLLGYSTIIAYFGVGLKNSELIAGRLGRLSYLIYGIIALVFFSYYDPSYAALLMRIAGAGLLIINIFGFFKLRKAVKFGI